VWHRKELKVNNETDAPFPVFTLSPFPRHYRVPLLRQGTKDESFKSLHLHVSQMAPPQDHETCSPIIRRSAGGRRVANHLGPGRHPGRDARARYDAMPTPLLWISPSGADIFLGRRPPTHSGRRLCSIPRVCSLALFPRRCQGLNPGQRAWGQPHASTLASVKRQEHSSGSTSGGVRSEALLKWGGGNPETYALRSTLLIRRVHTAVQTPFCFSATGRKAPQNGPATVIHYNNKDTYPMPPLS